MRTTLLTASLLAALAAPSLAFPSAASAQMRYSIQAFGEPPRQLPIQLSGTGSGARPIGLEECLANLEIPIEIANIPSTDVNKVFSVFRAAVGSGSCNDASSRMSSTGTPACTLTEFPAPTITSTTMTVSPTVQQLFGSAACDASTNNTQEFWFLAVSSAGDVSTTVPAGSFLTVPILLDTQAPSAVSVDPNPGGDTQIAVTWDLPSASEALFGANVYVDTAGCDESGNVISTTLTPGELPPASLDPRTFEGRTIDTATLDGAELGLRIGQYAAVGVTLLDLARNEGVLSNVVCMQRVEVSGFWDSYCAERGMTDPAMCRDTFGCATNKGRGSVFALAIAGLAIVLVGARRARRSAR